MSLTKLDICNAALIKLGCDIISDIDADLKTAKLCKARYDNIRDALLRSHPWKFATKTVALSQTTFVPLFGYSLDYQLPVDYLRAIKVYPDNAPYKIEGDKLLSNDSGIILKYTAKIATEAQYDPQFGEALAWMLAMDLSYALVQDRNYRQQLFQEGRLYLAEARSSNAQEEYTLQ